MNWLLEFLYAVRSFVEEGGPALVALFVATMFMWICIVERLLYLYTRSKKKAQFAASWWRQRLDQSSPAAEKIRAMLLARHQAAAMAVVPMVRALISVCLLLGLLGTVMGMIEVFNVLAIAGNTNPRAMAHGVGRATVPTMAGMVAALSGMYFGERLQHAANKGVAALREKLVLGPTHVPGPQEGRPC